MEQSESAGATPPRRKAEFSFIDGAGAPCAIAAGATGIRVGVAGGWSWTHQLIPNFPTSQAISQDEMRRGFFALFGAMELARQTLRGSMDPVADLEARFSRVSSTAWGDERPAKAKKAAKPDPVEEMLGVIAAVKQAKGLPFDEAESRKRLCFTPEGVLRDAKALSAHLRLVRKEPNIAAELERRKAAAAGATPDALAGL